MILGELTCCKDPEIGDTTTFTLDTPEDYEEFYNAVVYFGVVVDKTETQLTVRCEKFIITGSKELFGI